MLGSEKIRATSHVRHTIIKEAASLIPTALPGAAGHDLQLKGRDEGYRQGQEMDYASSTD